MERVRTSDLVAWLSLPRRRPWVLRGARQVGKTWLVRDLAARSGRELVEMGQALRLGGDPTGDGPRLFYWQREGGRPGEIDFLIQAGGRIVPIEIKAGAAGAMKSLHQFMFDKKPALAVRIDENPPSIVVLRVTTTQGDAVRYRLLGLPVYLAWRTAELAAGLPKR